MPWFRKEQKPIPIRASREFVLGQIVYHKIDGLRVVIVGFYEDALGEMCVAAWGSGPGAEGEFHLSELTHTQPPPINAVDPSAQPQESGPRA